MEPFKQSFININFIDMIGLEMKKRVQWESPPPLDNCPPDNSLSDPPKTFALQTITPK